MINKYLKARLDDDPVERILKDSITNKLLLPIISNSAINTLLLGGQINLIREYVEYREYVKHQKYAEGVEDLSLMSEYSLEDIDEQLKVTNFLKILPKLIGGFDNLDGALKDDYVKYIKLRMLDLAETQGTPSHLVANAFEMQDESSVAEFAQMLKYPNFETHWKHPLLRLAAMPIPIYLTTSHHKFLELALEKAGKEPLTEYTRERDSQSELYSRQPTVKEPWVYHLHGIDEAPDSLVLTEDDYFEYLTKVVALQSKQGSDIIHPKIREVISNSYLVLLGYDVNSWEFKAIFWGLIKNSPDTKRGRVSIQLQRTGIIREYYKNYLRKQVACDVVWSDIETYVEKLYQIWSHSDGQESST